MTAVQVAATIADAVGTGRRLWIANLNLHGLYMLETDAAFADFTRRADLCLMDGWPILALVKGRRLGSAYRVGSSDWLDALVARGGGFRIVAVGGSAESSEKAARYFNENFDLNWIGFSGFNVDKNDAAIREALTQADIVCVGMGMGQQEAWILDHVDVLDSMIVANVGGCFDLYSGEQKMLPRWIGALGLEWLVRLLMNPRRLAGRYLVEPLKLGKVVASRFIRREISGRTQTEKIQRK
jgi:N-acetylglucosaminyldiphosphoundecaprenol N-acetyl-beta-D-mannosaminyltransferase